MKNLKIKAILLNVVLAIVGGLVFGGALGVSPIVASATIFTIGTVPQLFKVNLLPKGVLNVVIQTEVWARDIEENLFAGNSFVMQSKNDGAFISNKKVHLPQSGTNPTVEVNRTTLPATISKRDDALDEYVLNEYTTDPILIQDTEDIQDSYDKRDSVLGQHVDTINERMALDTMFAWAPSSAKVVETSGASTGVLPHGTATGTRKAIVLKDLFSLASAMTKDNVPNDGRRMLLMPADLYYELVGGDTSVLNADLVNSGKLPDGIQNQIAGFNIMIRSSVTLYSGGQEPKAVGSADAIDDNLGAIAWHPNFVRKATSGVKVFADNDKPEYYGSVFSAHLLHGASKSRPTSEVGTFALVQGV